uniref:LITAF domain-containing protein n=1 Tax=Panagrellus redivivus TaxID=6233 RepID=A0A7E4VTA2_PANRE
MGNPPPTAPCAPPATVIHIPAYTGCVPVGRDPTLVVCPVCHNHVTTVVNYESGTFTYLMSFLCCWFFLCCCIPFCIDGFKDAVHTCPHCHATIGVDKKM